MTAADPRGRRRRAARLGARLRRHELDARRRARRRRAFPSRTSRPGCGASTSRCRRSGTGSRSTGSPRCSSAPTSARRAQLAREGVAGTARGRRRRDGRRDADLRADRAAAARSRRSTAPTRALTIHRRGEHRAGAAARRSSRRSAQRTAASSSRCTRGPAASSTRTASSLPPNVEAIEPLGYLEMLALVARRRASSSPIRADCRRRRTGCACPCVTLRPNTEWVDTVAAGANAPRPSRRELAARARGARFRPTHRRSTATATPPKRSRQPCTLDRRVRGTTASTTSPSSARATSASRSQPPSPRPAAASCSSTLSTTWSTR